MSRQRDGCGGLMPMLARLVVCHWITAHGAVAVDLRRHLAGSGQRERHADHRIALNLAAGQIERAQDHLAGLAPEATKPHLPALATTRLDDEVEAAGAGVPYRAALPRRLVAPDRGVGEHLCHEGPLLGTRSGTHSKALYGVTP